MTDTSGPTSSPGLQRAENPPPSYYDVQPTGCWEWNRARSPHGYGRTRYGGGYQGAHRAYFAHYNGSIPAGLVVMHLCDNRCCVNPDHLALGTHAANQGDMLRKRRSAWGVRHGSAKLTADQALEIYRRCRDGEKQAALANEFGVKVMQVSRIMRGINWADVTNAA